MGGSVTIVLKEPSGVVHKMRRWTNPLPIALTDPRLYSPDPSGWIKQFMNPWLGMRQDFEAHQHDKLFAFPQTPVYFPWNSTAPSEYGVVLIDLHAKQIHSMQHYCTEPYAIELEALHTYEAFHPERAASIKGLLSNGVITRVHIKNRGADWKSLQFNTPIDPDQAWNTLIALSKKSEIARGVLELSPPGFVIRGYKETDREASAFMTALTEAGIQFDQEDRDLWQVWAERHGGSLLRDAVQRKQRVSG